MSRRVRLFVFGIPLLLGVSGLAYAYFTSQGGGAGAGATGSLASPVINTATPGAGTVTLAWGAVPPPATGSVNYFVTANGGTPPGGTCGTSGSPISATTCTVTGLSAGSNSFTVTAVWNSFTSTSTPPTPVTLTSGAATKLAFSTQPTVGQNIQATGTGTFLAAVTVQDANGNTVTTATNAVTLAIGTNPSAGVLACTNSGGLTVNAVSGVANFTGCSITKVGTGYTLAATSSPVLTPPVNANAFNITAGAASQLVFTTQPVAGVPLGTNFATSPKVSVEDANSNVVTSDTGTVTLAIASGPGGASLTCSNPGFPTIAAVAGVATFTNCQISGTLIGTFTLQATRSGLTTATSNPVVIIL
jgi:trimeric autotransporter adhesin